MTAQTVTAPPLRQRPPTVPEYVWRHMSGWQQMRSIDIYRKSRLTVVEEPDPEPGPEVVEREYTYPEMVAGRRAYEAWRRAGRSYDLPSEDRSAWRAYQRHKDASRRTRSDAGQVIERRPREFTADEMAAGRRAYEQWVESGKAYELPDLDRLAWRAYKREKDRERRGWRSQVVVRSGRFDEAAELVDQSLSLEEVAAVMGVKPKSLDRQLRRVPGGRELLVTLRAKIGRASCRERVSSPV